MNIIYRALYIKILLAAIIVLLVLQPSDAYAAYQNCSNIGKGLLSTIIECVELQIDTLAETWLRDVVDAMGQFVSVMCVLAIMYFGVRAGMGVIPALRSETSILLIKIVFIVAFAVNAEHLLEYRVLVTGTANAMGGLVLSVLGTSIPACQAVGFVDGVFGVFDCLIGQLLGVKTSATFGESVGISVVAVGLLFTQYGLLILLLITSMLSAMFASVIITLFLYIRSMLALMFLAGIAPIIIPTILFKPLSHLFDKWWKYIIFYTLMPVVMTAFIAMMLATLSVCATHMSRLYSSADEIIADDNQKSKTVVFQTRGTTLTQEQYNKLNEKGLLDGAASRTKYVTTGDNLEGIGQIHTTRNDDAENNAGMWELGYNRIFDAVYDGVTDTWSVVKVAGDGVQSVYNVSSAAIAAYTTEFDFAAARAAAGSQALIEATRLGYKYLQGTVMAPFLSWTSETIHKFIALAITQLILFLLMLQFLRILPQHLMQMVASGNVAGLPGAKANDSGILEKKITGGVSSVLSAPRAALANKKR
jgi:hypothetical protein